MVNRVSMSRCESRDQVMSAQPAVVTSIASHLPPAARIQMALEAGGLIAGAMAALQIPVFICDGAGIVLAQTPTAAALLQKDLGLSLKSERLCVDNVIESQALDDAIAAAAAHCQEGVPPHRAIVVRSGRIAGAPLVLEVLPLPRREFESEFAPRVLVVARGARVPSERKAAIVQAAYSLTAAETQIAMQIGAGGSPQSIAAGRGVAVGTVRTQIKTICAKFGVRRQAELVARLNEL
jgi:DNA-binding CsgD family transcriptional regulator